MFSCLTEIFLSTTSAERCKINLGKAGVEAVWLPENRLSWERFHLALPGLPRKEETGVLTVSQGVLGRPHAAHCRSALAFCSIGSRAASGKARSHSLSRSRWLVCQHSPSQVPVCGWVCRGQNKPNQRPECYFKGKWWVCFHRSSYLLFGARVSACRGKRTDWGIWNPGCTQCLWLAGWRALELTHFLSLSDVGDTQTLSSLGGEAVISFELLGRLLSEAVFQVLTNKWNHKMRVFAAEAEEAL